MLNLYIGEKNVDTDSRCQCKCVTARDGKQDSRDQMRKGNYAESRANTVWYGFETDSYCFKCRVKNGYLTGQRSKLPDDFGWMIGQHIDVVCDFVNDVHALYIVF